MNKIITFITASLGFLVISSTNVLAAWSELGSNDVMVVAIDADTLRRVGDKVQILSMLNFKKPGVDPKTRETINSIIGLNEFNCSNITYRTLEYQEFSGNRGAGRIVSDNKTPDTSFQSIANGSWPAGVFNAACKKTELAASQSSVSDAQTLQQNIPSAIPVSSFNQGTRIALVIGNAAYKLHPLDNPKNDADDMSRALRATGFEVIDVRDASLAQMRSAVRQFGDKLLTKDVGLVYYSGHGMEVKGRNYFIPVNADIKRSDEVVDQSLDVSLILDKMETAKKGVNILIVDACRDDPFGRSFRSGNRGLATMDAPQGTIIAFATSPGKVAADGSGRNSPYTKNLVKVMQLPNIPIEQVFKQVRRAVQEETKNQQTPWENTSLSGDFYFSVKK